MVRWLLIEKCSTLSSNFLVDGSTLKKHILMLGRPDVSQGQECPKARVGAGPHTQKRPCTESQGCALFAACDKRQALTLGSDSK